MRTEECIHRWWTEKAKEIIRIKRKWTQEPPKDIRWKYRKKAWVRLDPVFCRLATAGDCNKPQQMWPNKGKRSAVVVSSVILPQDGSTKLILSHGTLLRSDVITTCAERSSSHIINFILSWRRGTVTVRARRQRPFHTSHVASVQVVWITTGWIQAYVHSRASSLDASTE
jgi:hypothetical protein